MQPHIWKIFNYLFIYSFVTLFGLECCSQLLPANSYLRLLTGWERCWFHFLGSRNHNKYRPENWKQWWWHTAGKSSDNDVLQGVTGSPDAFDIECTDVPCLLRSIEETLCINWHAWNKIEKLPDTVSVEQSQIILTPSVSHTQTSCLFKITTL